MPGATEPTAVIVPMKSFALAKSRLAGVLDPSQRSALARWMAERVLAATGTLPTMVVCDDPEVADFATAHGARTVWTPGKGLNAALASAVRTAAGDGHPRVVLAAGDLPFAHHLDDLAGLVQAPVPQDAVLVVPDRHLEGTNVVSFPSGAPLRLAFGPDSYRRHLQGAERTQLPVVEIHDEALGWDVDTPADLQPPRHLGALPLAPAPAPSGPRADSPECADATVDEGATKERCR